MTLHGKVALVTGGASGIGLAYIASMLENGISKVYSLDKNKNNGNHNMKLLSGKFGNGRMEFIEADITSRTIFEDAVKSIVNNNNALNIFVNNAGVVTADPETVVATNLVGTMYGIELGFKYLNKGGVIVNTASILGLIAWSSIPIYTATKHAVIGLTRAFGKAKHYQRTGIKTIAICPGKTVTSMLSFMNHSQSNSTQIELLNLNMSEFQPSKAVGDALIHVLEEGTSGSIWIVENAERPYEIQIPHYTQLKKILK